MKNHESIRAVFIKNSPNIELLEYNSDMAVFQLSDCDCYKIGILLCERVEAICLTTREELYKNIEFFDIRNPPTGYEFLSESLSEGTLLVVFTSYLMEEEPDESLLPLFNGSRQGYIVCKSISYKEEAPE